MEHSELRDAFFAEVHRDPYAHMIANVYAEGWASGQESALDAAIAAVAGHYGIDSSDGVAVGPFPEPLAILLAMRRSQSYGDRREAALEHLTDVRRESEARTIVALAAIGHIAGSPT